LEVLRLQDLQKKFWAQFHKNKAVCREIQTHFGSFRLMRFMKKVLGAISQFMCPKTKLFPVKFRRMSEVFRLQVLQKMF